MATLLGCIADDFTGATDLAGLLGRSGVPVRLHLGVPDTAPDPDSGAPFEIIALKCRTTPAANAVDDVLAAWNWLSAQGARRAFWKYCSTFDSTAQGNIGPVADALLQSLQEQGVQGRETAAATLHCPAFPENGRRVFMGELFVNDQLLHESPMKDHPLTPMRDSDLARLLGAQTTHTVGKLTSPELQQDNASVRARLDALMADGITHIIGDANVDSDLVALARATEHFRLICGASALASHLPALFRVRGFLSSADQKTLPPAPTGARLVLSGSCSEMTRQQVQAWPQDAPVLALDPLTLADDPQFESTLTAFRALLQDATARDLPMLVYATAEPEVVTRVQTSLGAEQAGQLVESVLAAIAESAVRSGVRRLVVAGGETSGAVAGALGIRQLDVGHEIVPGVPWCQATATVAGTDNPRLAISLKSGNFGDADFFTEAFERIDPPPPDVPADQALIDEA